MMQPLTNDYAVEVATPPAVEPVSLDRAKTQCAVEISETHWNGDLLALITAAREYVERRAGISLITQTLNLYLPRFPAGRDRAYLPRGPVASLTTVAYVDPAGTPQTLASCDLSAGYAPAFILPPAATSWPEVSRYVANPVTITYDAGTDNPTDTPAAARQLILMLVAHWFRNREAVGQFASAAVEHAADALFAQLSPGDEFIQYGAPI